MSTATKVVLVTLLGTVLAVLALVANAALA